MMKTFHFTKLLLSEFWVNALLYRMHIQTPALVITHLN